HTALCGNFGCGDGLAFDANAWCGHAVSGRALNARRSPPSLEQILLRPVDEQGHVEAVSGRRKPVRFLALPGSIVLDVNIQRAVRVEIELVAISDRVAVERVRDEEVFVVVHGKRPEGGCRRRLALVAMQYIPVCAAEDL